MPVSTSPDGSSMHNSAEALAASAPPPVSVAPPLSPAALTEIHQGPAVPAAAGATAAAAAAASAVEGVSSLGVMDSPENTGQLPVLSGVGVCARACERLAPCILVCGCFLRPPSACACYVGAYPPKSYVHCCVWRRKTRDDGRRQQLRSWMGADVGLWGASHSRTTVQGGCGWLLWKGEFYTAACLLGAQSGTEALVFSLVSDSSGSFLGSSSW
eukprot:909062-Pelagomonas_calceolata.AAC.4